MSAVADRRVRAAVTSLVVGTIIFLAKIVAYWRTGSSAILSDALESIVNVVAAAFAVYAVRFAAMPADRDHPYGHGKMEYLSAAFEGGLVGFAALTIVYSAIRALMEPPQLHSLGQGMILSAAAAVANLLLGLWLLRTGKASSSPTLIADGHHVLSDVWTTVGAIVGVALVRLTGLTWIDPATAILLALLLLRTAFKLVLSSASGLMDREDPELLQRLVDAFNATDIEGIGGVHHLRAIRSGDVVHVDAHVYVPHHWTVARAHAAAHQLEESVKEKCGLSGEIALHFDTASDDWVRRVVTLDEATRGPR
ncbi:MAG: cation diffusion facilitator family transporter [Polyangiales bacterium]